MSCVQVLQGCHSPLALSWIGVLNTGNTLQSGSSQLLHGKLALTDT
jgi:hypothetical protein